MLGPGFCSFAWRASPSMRTVLRQLYFDFALLPPRFPPDRVRAKSIHSPLLPLFSLCFPIKLSRQAYFALPAPSSPTREFMQAKRNFPFLPSGAHGSKNRALPLSSVRLPFNNLRGEADAGEWSPSPKAHQNWFSFVLRIFSTEYFKRFFPSSGNFAMTKNPRTKIFIILPK